MRELRDGTPAPYLAGRFRVARADLDERLLLPPPEAQDLADVPAGIHVPADAVQGPEGEEGELTRVGDTTPRHVNVRVVSATNRDLAALVKEGRFRGDLYYRLRGREISLPSLSERRDDIPGLIHYYLGSGEFAVVPRAMHVLQNHEWQGNVRELRNVAANLKGVCTGNLVTREAVEWVVGGDKVAR